MAITYNNLSVIALKQANFVKAVKSAKLAVSLMEPQIFHEINSVMSQMSERERTSFNERLQVLLIGYFNLGIGQSKSQNIAYAKKVYEQG